MAESTETGFKWWMRYIIVPLIGGGGIIAIVIAVMERPAATPTAAKSDLVLPQRPEETARPQLAPGVSAPAPDAHKPENHPSQLLPSFIDLHLENMEVEGGEKMTDVTFSNSFLGFIDWTVQGIPKSATLFLVERSPDGNQISRRSVPAYGVNQISKERSESFFLEQELDGETRILAKVTLTKK